MMNNVDYNSQEKSLLKRFIDMQFLPEPENNYEYFRNDKGIELILRAACDQKCEYCYLNKYGHDLYPYQAKKEELLKNVDLILDYIYVQKRNFLYTVDFFGGDIFSDDLMFDIFALFDKYLDPILKTNPQLFDRQILFAIPNNLAWVYYHPEKVPVYREWFYKFQEKYGIFISLSWSTDGLYATDTREKKAIDQNYYDVIFSFVVEFKYGFHPMIAAENIANWCKNYDWWMDMYQKFDLKHPYYFQPYLLEVRNDNWTDENIEDYKKFLKHLMDWRLKMCDNDYNKLAHHLINGSEAEFKNSRGADPLRLLEDDQIADGEGMGCSLQGLLHFDCNTLKIVPCHRLSYAQFVAGNLILNEEKTKIIDIEPHNVSAYITFISHKTNNYPLCSYCEYRNVCLKGCLGAQFEKTGEVFLPIPSVCKLFQAKNDYLVELYHEYHIFENAIQNDWYNQKRSRLNFMKERARDTYGYEC